MKKALIQQAAPIGQKARSKQPSTAAGEAKSALRSDQ